MTVEIDRAEFEAWRENPVTEAVFAALERKANQAREEWARMSFDAEVGSVDVALLADLRAVARMSLSVVDMTFEELQSEMGDGGNVE